MAASSAAVEQVLAVCPDYYDAEDIEHDLSITGDVNRTINNCLDGTISRRDKAPKLNYYRSDEFELNKTISTTDCNDGNKDDLISSFIDEIEADCESLKTKIKNLETDNRNNNKCNRLSSVTNMSKKPNSNRLTHKDFYSSGSDDEDILIPSFKSRCFAKLSEPVASTSRSSAKLTIPHYDYSYVEQDDLPDLDDGVTVSQSTAFSLEPGVSQDSLKSIDTLDSLSSLSSDVSARCSSSTSRKKKSSDNSQDAEQKRLKKDEREQAKLQKQLEKEKAKEERERLKKQQKLEKERERAEKQARQETHKSLKPGECQKYLTTYIDTELVESEIGAAIVGAFQGGGTPYKITRQLIPMSITWGRRSVRDSQQMDSQGSTSSESEMEESSIIIFLKSAYFASLVYNSNLMTQQDVDVTDVEDLLTYVGTLTRRLKDKRINLFVEGMEKYYRDVKCSQQQQYRKNVQKLSEEETRKRGKKGANLNNIVSRIDVEEAMVELQMRHPHCQITFYESTDEGAKMVTSFTKAVAEIPYKQSRLDNVFSFMPDTSGSAKVEKSGKGLLKVWRLQLQQFRNVSTEVANAVIAEYSSPQLLVKAYNRLTPKEGEGLLKDIKVRRGAGPLETNRRIGKELSRKIYELMTTDDPNFILK